jgi:inner membrane protein involved in colicin E2 resistance
MDPPDRLNPGPLAARITFFAPVSLLFFFTVMLVLGVLEGRSLHPVNYFFLAAAFFAFHLLLAYLVDHVNVHAAFSVAAVASVFLVVSYLRVVGGWRMAVRQAGLAQAAFLVLFSYSFFFEGYTGLTVTIGAVVALFVLMQATAKVDWDAAFADGVPALRRDASPPARP